MMQSPLINEKNSGRAGVRLLWLLLFFPCFCWGEGELYFGSWHGSIILNGYIGKFAYDDSAFDTSLRFDVFRARSIINQQAQEAVFSPVFSALIREG